MLIRVRITFLNQGVPVSIKFEVLDIWSKFQKMQVSKILDKQQESFPTNIYNFLVISYGSCVRQSFRECSWWIRSEI